MAASLRGVGIRPSTLRQRPAPRQLGVELAVLLARRCGASCRPPRPVRKSTRSAGAAPAVRAGRIARPRHPELHATSCVERQHVVVGSLSHSRAGDVASGLEPFGSSTVRQPSRPTQPAPVAVAHEGRAAEVVHRRSAQPQHERVGADQARIDPSTSGRRSELRRAAREPEDGKTTVRCTGAARRRAPATTKPVRWEAEGEPTAPPEAPSGRAPIAPRRARAQPSARVTSTG